MFKEKVLTLALATALGTGAAGAVERATENMDNWVIGTNQPVVESGIRADGSTGNYISVPVGTSPFYYEASQAGEGSVTLWVYDPGMCLSNPNPGYPTQGPRWGLMTDTYQAFTVGINRAAYLAGCQGYSPSSTVAPYSAGWFKDGVRGSHDASFTPGWYKWTITAEWDAISFTLHDVLHEVQDGPPHDDYATGDVTVTYDAASMGGMWEAVFGDGWKALYIAGDGAAGVENIKIDIVSASGVFEGMAPVTLEEPGDTVVVIDPPVEDGPRATEGLDNWIIGTNGPEVATGVRADGSTGNYISVPVGTSPFYYEASQAGEGSVTLWVYDPGNCLDNPSPGYPTQGPRWGLMTDTYHAFTVGINRAAYVSGCQGYSPSSTVAPYSAGWFADGVRASQGATFSPGWYKWTITAEWDAISFTLHDVIYETADGPPHDDLVYGDVTRTYDAASMGGMWEAVFGDGWKSLYIAGDGAGGVEDIKIDVVAATGVFAGMADGSDPVDPVDPVDTVVVVDPPDTTDDGDDDIVIGSLDNWTTGTNPPELVSGMRADGTTGEFISVPAGTSPFYARTEVAGEGSITMWVYDPANCLSETNPGFSNLGPRWGLMTDTYHAVTVGISRQAYVAGCQGYSPWSTVAPYSSYWFQAGVRGHAGLPFTAGWQKWTISGTWDAISFTLHDADYIADGGAMKHGDITHTYDASSFGGSWEAVFGDGWNGIYIAGDGASGIEDIKIDIVSATGVFANMMEVREEGVVVDLQPADSSVIDVTTVPELAQCPRLRRLKMKFGQGCLDSAMTLSVKVKVDFPADCNPVAAVDFTINGKQHHTFGGEVTIELPYDALLVDELLEDMLTIGYWNETSGNWEVVADCEIDKDNKVIRASVNHFSTYGIIPDAGTSPVHEAPAQEIVFSELPLAVAPNPVRDVTFINVGMAAAGEASIGIWDMNGTMVKSMVRSLPAGTASISWDGTDRNGAAVANGMYLVRVQSGTQVNTVKLHVVK